MFSSFMLVISCYIHDELAAYHPIEQVALFIATLTSFIIQANTQLKRDPADIANDLLKAMYIQMIAQSNNPSIPPADPDSFFLQSQSDHEAAVIQNALLYTSLSLCIIVDLYTVMCCQNVDHVATRILYSLRFTVLLPQLSFLSRH